MCGGAQRDAALAIKPDYDLALNNWGMVLAYQARAKTGPDADALLTLAGEKCAAALAIKPEMGAAHYNWATALFQQAKTKAGQEADALFARACEE